MAFNADVFRRIALAIAFAGLAAAPVHGQERGSTLRGRVIDQRGQPLAGALIIRRSPAVDTSRTDSAGRFAVARLASGRHIFIVQCDGFSPMEMEVSFPSDTTLEVDVPLEPGRSGAAVWAAKLDSVGYTSRRQDAQGRRGRGSFLGPEEVAAAQRNASRVTQLFVGIDGVQVDHGPTNLVALLGDGGNCVFRIFVNGQIDPDPYNLDRHVRTDDVLAIEVFPRPSLIPREFQRAAQLQLLQTRTGECGAALIWLK